jgi:hypothetical protein
MIASYKTFSYKFWDDVDYDLIFGGHYADDGSSLEHGFAGYMLEIRLYSSGILSLDNLDSMIDWDCTLHTTKHCEFCPALVFTTN